MLADAEDVENYPLASPAVEDEQEMAILIPGRSEPVLIPSRIVDIPGVLRFLNDESGRVNTIRTPAIHIHSTGIF